MERVFSLSESKTRYLIGREGRNIALLKELTKCSIETRKNSERNILEENEAAQQQVRLRPLAGELDLTNESCEETQRIIMYIRSAAHGGIIKHFSEASWEALGKWKQKELLASIDELACERQVDVEYHQFNGCNIVFVVYKRESPISEIKFSKVVDSIGALIHKRFN